MSRKSLLIVLVAVTVTLSAAGGGFYVWQRRQPMLRAEQAVASGQWRQALLELRVVVRDDPRNAAAYLMLGQVHARMGDLLSAERDLKRARSLGADRWEIMGQLGLYYLADRRFRDVLAEVPASGGTPAVNARNLALRSRAQTGMGELKAATESLDAAAKLGPGNAEVQVSAARLALARRQPDQALASLDAALQTDPTNLEALLLKSQVAAAQGDVPAALELADKAVLSAPGYPAPRLHRAGLLLAIGQDARARADVSAVLASQPRNAAAIYLDGVLAVHEQRFADAGQRLGNLGPTAARFPRAAYFQAQAALAQGLASTAVDAADRYAIQAPDDPDGVRLLARAQAANRRPDQAIATLSAAVARGVDDAQTLDMLGTVRAGIGDLDGAEQAFRQALEKAPDSPAILAHRAGLGLQRGDPGRAVQTLEQASRPGEENAAVLQALAVAQIASGDVRAAEATTARLRALTGATETVGLLGGMLALARFDAEGAVKAFTATVQAFPDSTVAALNLARALTAAGRRDQARIVLRDLLAKDPRNPGALNSFIQFEAATGDYAAAIRATDGARAAAPADNGILALSSDVLVRAGDPARAVALITRSRAADRRPPILLAALARAQRALNQTDEAENSYGAALAAGPDAAISLALAELQAARGDLARARATLDAAIAAAPAQYDLLTRRVELEARTSGVPGALMQAAAFRADPAQMPTAAVLAGDALMRAKQPAEAVQAFRREWDAAPSPGLAVRLAEAQLAAGDDAGAERILRSIPNDLDGAVLMAQLGIRTGQWADAVRSLELALRGRPDEPGLVNNLAVAYQRTGDPRARATAQRAYLLDPTADSADTLGWIMVGQGAVAEAVPILQQAAQKRPGDPVIASHLAAALAATGQDGAAAALLRTALAGNAAFDGRAEAAALLAKLGPRP